MAMAIPRIVGMSKTLRLRWTGWLDLYLSGGKYCLEALPALENLKISNLTGGDLADPDTLYTL